MTHWSSFLRFDVDAPMEFFKQVLPNFEKPEFKDELVKPEPTGLELIDHLELGLYEEKLAEVRHYNDYVNNTSLKNMHGAHLMFQLKWAITKTFAKLYYGKVNILDIPNIEENFLVFDSSDETMFSHHIIIPGVHVENHMEAEAFAEEAVKNLDAKFSQPLTWASTRASRTSVSI